MFSNLKYRALLSDADYALGRLAGATGRLVNPYLIGQPLLRREAILSSRIRRDLHDAGAARPAAEMTDALRIWERDLHLREDPLPLLVRLAVAHYQFEAIHPFRDGNGRVGRLLIPLMLCAHQRLTEPLLYMSAYFDRNRQQYVDLLLRVSTHGAWREWVGFFVQGVNECAQDGLRLADGLLALRERYHAAVRTSRASVRFIAAGARRGP